MSYALFIKKERKKTDSLASGIEAMWRAHMRHPLFGGSDDEEESDTSKAEAGETLVFIGKVETPEEVAAMVRKAPLEKYVLFRGEFVDVQIAIPVFIEGKNLDTLGAEWGGQP